MKRVSVYFILTIVVASALVATVARYVDTTGKTPLMFSSAAGRTSITQSLIACGADVNATDIKGWTVLMCACVNGQTDSAQILTSHGADINAKNNAGNTALMQAAWYGYPDTIRFLLEHGANPNLTNKRGETALSIANKRGNRRSAQILNLASRSARSGLSP